MTITDARMAWGEWNLKLRDDTPTTILEQLRLAYAAWGLVRVYPGNTDANAIVAGAPGIFTGVYLKRPDRFSFGGYSATMLLGEASDGKKGSESVGPLRFSSALTGNRSLSSWITTILTDTGCQIRSGTINTGITPGTLKSGTFFFQTPKTTLDRYICPWYHVQYRVNPDLTLDVGTATDLWPTPPRPKLAVRHGVRDPDVDGFDIEQVDIDEDYSEWASGVVTNQGIAVGSEELSPNPFGGPARLYGRSGTPMVWRRYVTYDGNDDTPSVAQLNDYAQMLLATQTGRQRSVTLSANEYALPDRLTPGEMIYVWDPDAGFYDLTNVITYQGKDIYPVALRVTAMTYPIEPGMQVWFDNRHNLSSDGLGLFPVELTPYIEWEDNATTITVGAPPRTLGSRRRLA